MGDTVSGPVEEQTAGVARALSCHKFGSQNQLYRGAKLNPLKPYIACLGSSETYARDITVPWPGLLGRRLDMQVMNWAQNSAGPGYYLRDAEMIAALSKARLTIIPVLPAHFLSNRLYSVLDRRNQMLKDVSELMTALYPDVDFARFETVNEMLRHLYKLSPDRFRVLHVELKGAYIARMRDLLQMIDGRTLLVWISPRSPSSQPVDMRHLACGPLPQFVTQEVLDAIRPYADGYAEHYLSPDHQGNDLTPEDHANIAAHMQSEVERLTTLRARALGRGGLRSLFGI